MSVNLFTTASLMEFYLQENVLLIERPQQPAVD